MEPNLLALARGFVLELKPTEIVIGGGPCFVGRLHQPATTHRTGKTPSERHIFRIDKDELASGMSRIRDNVAHLFYANGGARLLDLVVDLRAPVFFKEDTLLHGRPFKVFDPQRKPASGSGTCLES